LAGILTVFGIVIAILVFRRRETASLQGAH
jgi:hypothetical protein